MSADAVAEVATVHVHPDGLDAIRETARAHTAPLLWLLDRGASPATGTLDALLAHVPGPAASLPVDRDGRAVESLMGRITETDAPAILDAVAGRRLPLRHAHVCSLLVERDLVLELEPPDPARFGFYAGREWTSRLFARRRGWLVPASRVTVPAGAAGSPLHALRAARSAGWRRGETVRELQRTLAVRWRAS